MIEILAVLAATTVISVAATLTLFFRLRQLQAQYKSLLSRHEQVAQQNGALRQQLTLSEQHQQEKLELVRQSKTQLSDQLQQLASQQQQSAQFQVQQLLTPLQDQIHQFRQRIDLLDKHNSQERSSLIGQIKQLQTLNQQLSNDANQLSSALLGDQKKQGDWGEMVLQRVLESSGLTPEREYRLQPSFKANHKQLRPDAVVYLPESRHIIIDAKVSLAAWHRYQSGHSKADSQALCQAIRNHIKDLANKDYCQIEALESPDFIILFFAIEPALQHALAQDPGLFDFAAQQNVLLVSANSLLISLKTVASLWRLSQQEDHARQITERANKLYDKLRSFIDHLDRAGGQLEQAQLSYQQAARALSSGPGNVMQQAQQLSELGVRGKKPIESKHLQRHADFCEPIPE